MASRTQQREFTEQAYAAAREAGLSGPQADLAVAQAVHETSWGTKPSGTNNYHGIKGPGKSVKTHEIVGGKRVNIKDSFRNFKSMADSFKAWGGLMGRRYRDVMAAPTLSDAVKGLRAGQQGGYATDPNYDSKVKSIAGKLSNFRETPSFPSIDRIATPFENPRSMMAKVAPVERGLLAPVQSASFPQGGLLNPPDMNMVSSAQASPASMARIDPARFGPTTPNVTLDSLRSMPNLSQPAYAQRSTPLTPQRAPVSVPALSAPTTPYSPTPASYQTPAFSTQAPRIDAFGQPPAPGLQPVDVASYAPTQPAAPALSAPRNISSPRVAPAIEAPIDAPQIDAPISAAFPDRPKPSFGLLSPAQTTPAKIGQITGALLGTAAMGPLGGLVGGLLGKAGMNRFGGGLLDPYSGPTQDVGRGLGAIQSVMGGGLAPGSTATASNGQTVTSLPGGGTQRYSPKFGWTEITTADGRTTRAKSTRGAGGNYGGVRSESVRDAIDKGIGGLF